jgi:hypothetical protein
MTRRKSEFNNFDNVLREVLKAPPSVVKARLEAEKMAKKRKKSKKSSASREAI